MLYLINAQTTLSNRTRNPILIQVKSFFKRLANEKDHLSYFHFVGRVFGMALYHNELLDVHFTNSFYKHILNRKIQLEDMESIDPDYYRNLQYILTNPIDGTFNRSLFSILTLNRGLRTSIFKPIGRFRQNRNCGAKAKWKRYRCYRRQQSGICSTRYRASHDKVD